MTGPDLDEFAALWQGDPDPEEQDRMEALAAKALRRGRLYDHLEFATVVALVAFVVAGSFVAASPITVALAVPLIAAVTWLTWRRRALRQMTQTLDASDRGAFIETSLRIARANLRRNGVGLASLPFLIPVALAFKTSLRTGGGLFEIWQAMVEWAQTPRAAITILLLVIVGALTLRSRRKIRREIRRLEKLRSGYELEAERDGEI